jgi:hypothetical protein
LKQFLSVHLLTLLLVSFVHGLIIYINTKAFVCFTLKIDQWKYLAVMLCLSADPNFICYFLVVVFSGGFGA